MGNEHAERQSGLPRRPLLSPGLHGHRRQRIGAANEVQIPHEERAAMWIAPKRQEQGESFLRGIYDQD